MGIFSKNIFFSFFYGDSNDQKVTQGYYVYITDIYKFQSVTFFVTCYTFPYWLQKYLIYLSFKVLSHIRGQNAGSKEI
tara:strand:+ start:1687 stop:1920 length:234 start_codon:yes stop_codon:yes gene_type:complete